jgi:putative sterol carrier protein
VKALLITAYDNNDVSGLFAAQTLFAETLAELGVTVETAPISYDNVQDITMKIKAADGVAFIARAGVSGTCAAVHSLFESVRDRDFAGKRCFILTASRAGGEISLAEYISRCVTAFGGVDAGRVSIGAKYLPYNEGYNRILDKYFEDYYRVLRQNREFFEVSAPEILPGASPTASASVAKTKPAPETTTGEIAKTLNLDAFTKAQQSDIADIAELLAKDFDPNKISPNSGSNETVDKPGDFKPFSDVAPRPQTARQRTQSLEHHFQPQLAAGLDVTFRLNISGEGGFEGSLIIANGQCRFADGANGEPTISIFCDVKVWNDILDGKFSAQKAFITGQLKVRGDFALLSRFEKIFKL